MLTWLVSWQLAIRLGSNARSALVFTFPFAMGLHVFRDLNWASPTDTAIFLVPLFGLGCFMAAGRKPLWWLAPLGVWTVSGLLSPPIALVIYVLAVAALFYGNGFKVNTLQQMNGSLLPIATLGVAGALIGPILGEFPMGQVSSSPVDLFQIASMKWGGLEWHRALNLVVLITFAWSVWRWRKTRVAWLTLSIVATMVVVSTGLGLERLPMSVGLDAGPFRPTLFAHVAWAIMCMGSALFATHAEWSRRNLMILYLLFASSWLIMVRSHPAYPPFHVM
jgi:hypothetical protein